MNRLVDLLAEEGISRLRSYQPGRQNRADCPRCGGGDHHERFTLSVHIDDDGRGATWRCWRGSCGWKAGVRCQ
jgi:twinkle protein